MLKYLLRRLVVPPLPADFCNFVAEVKSDL